MDHRLILFLRRPRLHFTRQHRLCQVQGRCRLLLHPLGQPLAVQLIRFRRRRPMHPHPRLFRLSYPLQKNSQGQHYAPLSHSRSPQDKE